MNNTAHKIYGLPEENDANRSEYLIKTTAYTKEGSFTHFLFHPWEWPVSPEIVVRNNPKQSFDFEYVHIETGCKKIVKGRDGKILTDFQTLYDGYKDSLYIDSSDHFTDELKDSADFFLYRANKFSIKGALKKYYRYAGQDFDLASKRLQYDKNFVLEYMRSNYHIYQYAHQIHKNDYDMLAIYLASAEASEIDWLPVNNRITIALKLYEINPAYERCFGSELKKRLNGMNILDYVEKTNLKKKLTKDLPKTATKPTRMKI